MLPTPAEVHAAFTELMSIDPNSAVTYLYELGVSSGYLQAEDSKQRICWTGQCPYGNLECTINLSKPEKDPLEIASAAQLAVSDRAEQSTEQEQLVPQCELCWQNEGFSGTPKYPAKPGLRIGPLVLGGERWGLQFSPHSYYPEHCIALSEEHRPMNVDETSFERLLDFVDLFPFYFIGSNADLPIVGGSILSHNHYQGGRYVFPLMKAPLTRSFELEGLTEVKCGIVKWPASVIRLNSPNRIALSRAAARILTAWRTFSCDACNIIAASSAQHNTLNAIVHKVDSGYVMDLVLRNNRTDAQHPWGIFHPDESLHHLKKENIGLIEIMGRAILPARLAHELPLVQGELIQAAHQGLSTSELTIRLRDNFQTASHATWASTIYQGKSEMFLLSSAQGGYTEQERDTSDLSTSNHLHPVIQSEVTQSFTKILEATGVFKQNPTGTTGWNTFIDLTANRSMRV